MFPTEILSKTSRGKVVLADTEARERDIREKEVVPIVTRSSR